MDPSKFWLLLTYLYKQICIKTFKLNLVSKYYSKALEHGIKSAMIVPCDFLSTFNQYFMSSLLTIKILKSGNPTAGA